MSGYVRRSDRSGTALPTLPTASYLIGNDPSGGRLRAAWQSATFRLPPEVEGAGAGAVQRTPGSDRQPGKASPSERREALDSKLVLPDEHRRDGEESLSLPCVVVGRDKGRSDPGKQMHSYAERSRALRGGCATSLVSKSIRAKRPTQSVADRGAVVQMARQPFLFFRTQRVGEDLPCGEIARSGRRIASRCVVPCLGSEVSHDAAERLPSTPVS